MPSLNKAGILQVDGIEHTCQQLQRVGDVLGMDTIIKALMQFAYIVRDRAKAHCPVGTGNTKYRFKELKGKLAGQTITMVKDREHLRDLIFAAEGKNRNLYTPSVIVGVDRKKAPHAHLVEFGHGGPQPAGPHPYLRPAADETAGEMNAVVGVYLSEALVAAGLGTESR